MKGLHHNKHLIAPFLLELKSLLERYEASISVDISSGYGGDTIEGLDVEIFKNGPFDGEHWASASFYGRILDAEEVDYMLKEIGE